MSQTGSLGKTLEQSASNAVFRKLRQIADNKVRERGKRRGRNRTDWPASHGQRPT